MQNSASPENPVSKVNFYKGGPYMIEGPCVIVDSDGKEIVKEGKIFLCRCGQSTKKPFCDGTHKNYEFDK
ncbi:MAG TPA: CDGSH iron-sulfur domain-containing protein [Ignavibacteriaceae bacterium]|jgi:CDGSH iron-sulfur domain-containing protein 3|nr:CDGSH iron-sulfur domain-containing protein [Ignavibacteriaceae bacterium]